MDRADSRLLGLAFAVAATACGDPITVELPADAAVDMDGTVDPMADAATSGLRVRFSTSPRVPGDFDGDDGGAEGTIERVDFDLRTLRVVGDVGMVAAPAIDLRFRGEPEFFEMSFGQAQPGIYGTFAAEVAHIDIRGTVDIGEEEFDFRINDNPPQGLDITATLAGVQLGSGQLVTIDIEIDVADLLSELDWSMAEPEDGEIRIDSDHDLIDAVRDELAESFEEKD